MNKLLVGCIALLAIGCSTTPEPESEVVVERTIEEINAERGDPCDCVASKLEFVDAFIIELSEGKYSNSVDLNNAFSAAMDGCMQPIGHKEADAAWGIQMKVCESFDAIKNAMRDVRAAALDIKNNEQNEFVEDLDSGEKKVVSDILEKLKEGAGN